MATFQPPTIRTLTAKIPLQWNDLIATGTNATNVVVDSYEADFANMQAGDQIQVDVGGVANTVILTGCTTPALVAAAFNALYPTAGPGGGPIAFDVGNAVRLISPQRIEIFNFFGVNARTLGLPQQFVRDPASGNYATRYVDFYNAQSLQDRPDLFSVPVTLPDGANRVVVWVDLETTDSTGYGSVGLVPAWNDSTGIGTITNGLLEAMKDPALVGGTITGINAPLLADFQPIYVPPAGSGSGLKTRYVFQFEPPPGATELRLAVMTIDFSIWSGGSLKFPFSPPKFTANLFAGAR